MKKMCIMFSAKKKCAIIENVMHQQDCDASVTKGKKCVKMEGKECLKKQQKQ